MTARMASGTRAQVRALVSLRWRMIRTRRTRRGLLALVAAALTLIAVAVVGATTLPQESAFNAALLTPTAFLVFALSAVVSPLAAGGGYDLFPAEQLEVYPVRPSTSFVVTLLMAPLNVAWAVQLAGLLVLTAYVVGAQPGLAAALAFTLVYVAAMTVTGQSLAWIVVGARRRRAGRLILLALVVTTTAAAALTLRSGWQPVLDRAPTRHLVIAMLAGGTRQYVVWGKGLALLVVLTVVATVVGARATAWALRRPPTTTARAWSGAVPRRSPRRDVGAELRAVDRASVWRAPALRRGALVIALMPAAVGIVARFNWEQIALTTGLVSAGAGLLFGVNIFCLDGSGAVWLASHPHDPRLVFRAKARVLVETCLVSATIAAVASGLRAQAAPKPAELAAVVAAGICCTALVVGTCLRLSVERPHRADLRGPRDTPAPPGTMAVYSTRLAVMTTFAALAVATMAELDRWWLPLAMGAAIAVLGVSAYLRTLTLFVDETTRSRVALTVSAG
jgi:hypothetical protein